MEMFTLDGWGGRLERFFYRQENHYVAIAPLISSEGNRQCELLCYRREAGTWQLAEANLSAAENSFSVVDTEMDENSCALLERLADWTVMELSKKGWQEAELVYVIPEEEIIGYVLSLPPNLTPAQQSEAAYWELDDKLAVRGLSAENFACLCEPLKHGETENQCMILGVRRSYLQEVQRVFAAVGLKLADVVACGEEKSSREVMERYLSSEERHGFGNCPETRWDWLHIAVCWVGMVALVLVIWAGMDIYAYEQARSAAEIQKAELAGLVPERQEMLSIEAMCESIEAREHLWQELQGKGLQWYSVLVHLGANTKEGVFLTRMVSSDDGRSLELEGQAADYDALAEFVDGLEQDRDFFPQGVTMHDAEALNRTRENTGAVKFSLTINWENQENDEKTAGTGEDT